MPTVGLRVTHMPLLDGETATDVVEMFRAVEAPDRVIRVRREIERLLRDEPDDDRLRSLLMDRHGMGFAAESDELTARSWLSAVADQLRRDEVPTAQDPPPDQR